MKSKLAVMAAVLLFVAGAFGQGDLDKYIGQYQVTGAPIMITVAALTLILQVEFGWPPFPKGF